MDGKPAVGAAVALHPIDANNGTHPLGQVDANGEFLLTTIRSGDGARPANIRSHSPGTSSAAEEKLGRGRAGGTSSPIVTRQ